MESNTVLMKRFYVAVLFLVSIPIHIFAQGDWNPVNPANSPDARYGHSMATLPDGTILLFGGEDAGGELLNDLSIFNETDWNPASPANSPDARQGHTMVTLPDGQVMLFGGENTEGDLFNDLFVFKGNDWNPVSPANDPPPARAYHGAAVTDDGKMVIVGGKTDTEAYSKDIWFYDPATKEWKQGTDSNTGFQGAAVAAFNNEVYVLGAWEKGKQFIYNILEDGWYESTPSGTYPPNSRNCPLTGQYGSKVFVFFGGGKGWDPDVGAQVIHSDFWIFDLAEQRWTQLADLPAPMYKSGAAAFEGGSIHVLAFGGLTEGEAITGETYEYVPEGTGVELFESTPTEWTLIQNYPNPFNPTTTINFNIPIVSKVDIKIFDIRGHQVRYLSNGIMEPGLHSVVWDGTNDKGLNLPSGTYLCKFNSGSYSKSIKLLLLK